MAARLCPFAVRLHGFPVRERASCPSRQSGHHARVELPPEHYASATARFRLDHSTLSFILSRYARWGTRGTRVGRIAFSDRALVSDHANLRCRGPLGFDRLRGLVARPSENAVEITEIEDCAA